MPRPAPPYPHAGTKANTARASSSWGEDGAGGFPGGGHAWNPAETVRTSCTSNRRQAAFPAPLRPVLLGATGYGSIYAMGQHWEAIIEEAGELIR